NIGRLVRVQADGHEVTGRIVAADDTGATLSVDGQENTYAYPDLRRGRIEVEFSRLAELDEDEFDEDEMTAFAEDDEDDFADLHDVEAAAHAAGVPDTDVNDDDERADDAEIDDDDINGGHHANRGVGEARTKQSRTTFDAHEEDER